MARVQQGDREAYSVLFSRYKDPLWSYMMRRTRDSEAASELYQETFLRLWRSAHTYKRDQPFRPWLYRVSNNLIRDRFRNSQRQVETIELNLESTQPARRIDPISGLDLERAIQELPDTLREAFLLGAVHGLNHKEVANILEISPSNARARVSRARLKIRTLLSEREVQS